MKLFKISIKFEQNGSYSERKADTEGYLIKPSDNDDMVEGYMKVLYPTNSEQVRFIKGLYTTEGSLIFIQMCNDYYLSPVCYCFPENAKEGYWSSFDSMAGFFPVYPGKPCSQGHATISIEEITDSSLDKLVSETSTIFAENSYDTTFINYCLMQDFRNLKGFLDNNTIFQMKLHCGKW